MRSREQSVTSVSELSYGGIFLRVLNKREGVEPTFPRLDRGRSHE